MDNDKRITDMLFDRDENGLSLLKKCYGKLIRSVCYSILGSDEDAEECENETYHAIWKQIPPDRPSFLKAYSVGIARHIALDRFRASHREKRVSSEMTDCLDDLGEMLTDDWSVEENAEENELKDEINSFLSTLDRDLRTFFVMRYYYCMPIKKIAGETGKSVKEVRRLSDSLKRLLKKDLKEKGFI